MDGAEKGAPAARQSHEARVEGKDKEEQEDRQVSSVFQAAQALAGVSKIRRTLTARLGKRHVKISDSHLRKLIVKATGDPLISELDQSALVKLLQRVRLPNAEVRARARARVCCNVASYVPVLFTASVLCVLGSSCPERDQRYIFGD